MYASLKSLGFEMKAASSLAPYLPVGRGIRPTLCLSDTHLLPVKKSYGSDVPDALADVLAALPEHQVFVLGDFIESLPLSLREVRTAATSSRLRRTLEELRYRDRLRVIPGNHDSKAIPFIKQYFGAQRVFIGGFRIGRVAFIHGHEPGLDVSGLAARMPVVVPIGGGLSRLGCPVPYGTASNTEISTHYSSLGLYAVFGHTHSPAACRTFANPGCFLAGHRSFLLLDGSQIALWEGH